MKRAVLCVSDPHTYINHLADYSIMVVNPTSLDSRKKYLLDKADWSLLITDDGIEVRSGADYSNERLFWYTSGTTGDSKFCSFTQAQLDNLTDRIIKSYDITANDRYVGIMPLWHAHGQGLYWATLKAKCEQQFVTIKEVKSMPDFHPTFISAVPDILRVIGQSNFDSLRFVRSASSALPDKLYNYLKDKFKVPVIEAFGMTEALSHCFTNPLNGEQRIGTVGLPDGIEADIRDGELYIQGFSLSQPGWYNTGDLAEQDQAGYYRIIGRSKDRINIRGYKIDPVSVERQLTKQIEDLGSCVVFGSEKVNCVYTGMAKEKDVVDALVNIHPLCNPAMIKQMDIIPAQDNGKLSRTWLKGHFQCK